MRPAAGVALILLQAGDGLLLQLWLHYGRDLALYRSLVGVNRVYPRVSALLDYALHSRGTPHRAVLAGSVPVLTSGRGLALVVEALCLRVKSSSRSDVGDDLGHYPGLILDDHE